MWVDVGELFDVNDDRFVVGIRELVANGIEVRIESVGNRTPGEVAIYVRDHVRGVAQKIMERAYSIELEAKPDFDHVYVSERYNEVMERKRNAPKGRSNGI